MFPFGSIIFPLALLSGLESFFQWTEKFSPLKKASGLSWVIVSLHQTNLIGILREISYFFFLGMYKCPSTSHFLPSLSCL